MHTFFIDLLLSGLAGNGYRIIVRPHPQYIRRFAGKLEEIKEKVSAYLGEDCRFEMDFSSNETVYTADILMTDWSGIAYEYAFSTERPVLFVHTPMKVVSEESSTAEEDRPDIRLRSVVGVDLMPETLAETLKPAVEQFTNEADQWHARIVETRGQYIYHFGQSGEVGAAYILKRLEEYAAERRRKEEEIKV